MNMNTLKESFAKEIKNKIAYILDSVFLIFFYVPLIIFRWYIFTLQINNLGFVRQQDNQNPYRWFSSAVNSR